MVKAPYYDKNGVKKGAWSLEEDDKLKEYVQRYGHWNWRELPKFAGMNIYIYIELLRMVVKNQFEKIYYTDEILN